MSSLIFVIGVVLFFLGLLASIALHELGHMLPAKKFGMKVSQYFVGFGRTVWSTKRGETEYGIKAIPFGGFVRIVGMFPPAVGAAPHQVRKANTGPFQTLIDNARHAEYETVDPADTPRLFYQKPWWQKLIVMAGGPLVNIVIAFVLFAGVFTLYGVDTPTTTVSSVTDCVIPASDAGRTCAPADKPSPAKQAGLHVGDKVIAFNGTKIDAWSDLTPLIRANGDKPATIVVERNGVHVTLTTRTIINQVYDTQNTQDPQKVISVGFLGVSPEQVAVRQNAGFVVDKMGELTVATVKALGSFPGKLVGVAQSIAGGQREQDSPMSVVGASRAAGELASYSDWTVGKRIAVLISLLASVNLFLALFNFIPLLPLDGGHIAGALWEAIKRGFAKLFRRPDPGYVDVAKLLPLAYVAASFIVVMGVLLVVADIVNPIKIFNG